MIADVPCGEFQEALQAFLLAGQAGALAAAAFGQHLAHPAREALASLGGLDPSPASGVFVHGDGDVDHCTKIVAHEVRVKMKARSAA
ncbi:MAG: hypothetical protein JNM59_09770 [Hyphomonadaceae bacterium]|nr:hypothetical protein [Hyphomonadaceae bacterium]